MANYQNGFNMRSPYRARPYPVMPECPCQRENRMTDCSCQREEKMTDRMDEFPIGMAYVPWQKWKGIYDMDKALQAGTIFAELDKPFLGRRVSKC